MPESAPPPHWHRSSSVRNPAAENQPERGQTPSPGSERAEAPCLHQQRFSTGAHDGSAGQFGTCPSGHLWVLPGAAKHPAPVPGQALTRSEDAGERKKGILLLWFPPLGRENDQWPHSKPLRAATRDGTDIFLASNCVIERANESSARAYKRKKRTSRYSSDPDRESTDRSQPAGRGGVGLHLSGPRTINGKLLCER